MATLTLFDIKNDVLLTSGSFSGSTNRVLAFQIQRDADGGETVSVTVSAAFDIGNAIRVATTPGAVRPVRLDLRLATDGTGPVAARALLENPQWALDATPGGTGMTITHTSAGLFRGYALTLVDHLTTHGVQLAHLLDAAQNAGLTTDMTGAGAGIGTSQIAARLKGYLQTVPGFTSWLAQNSLRGAVAVDSSISALAVDSDEQASPIAQAVLAAIGTAAGLDTGDTVGVRAHYVADSSDSAAGNLVSGVDGVSYGVGLSIGQTTASGVHFTQTPAGAGDVQILSVVAQEVQLQDCLAQVALVGGSNAGHGLPQGATITGMLTINNENAPSGDWDASLLVLGVKTGTGAGGVFFYHPESRSCWACSPSFAVNALWYDPPVTPGVYNSGGNALYAATEQGVYRAQQFWPGSHQAPAAGGWTQIGGNDGTGSTEVRAALGARCTKVLAETTGGNTYVTALFDGTSQEALRGVFIHPRVTDTGGSPGVQEQNARNAGAAAGYDQWTLLDGATGIVDYCYLAASDTLIVTDPRNPAALVVRSPARATPTTSAGTPNSPEPHTLFQEVITGLDWVSADTVVIRTANGAAVAAGGTTGFGSLYYWKAGVALIDGQLQSMGTAGLVDGSGAPVMVNRVYAYSGNANYPAGTIGGITPTFIAATDSGLYYTTGAIGSCTWTAIGAQSGIADQNILHAAFGTPQYLIDAAVTNNTVSRIFASTGDRLFVSHSDGLFFDDELADPVDLGLYWLAVAQDAGDAQNLFGGSGPKIFPEHDLVGYAWSGWPSPGAGNTPADPGYVGTPGLVHLVNDTKPTGNLPAGFVWVSPIDERGKRSYRLANLHGDAPYAGTHAGEISEIVADAGTPAATAASRLAAAHLKELKEGGTVQVLLTLESAFPSSQPTHALATLRPMQTVTATVADSTYGLTWTNQTFYVRDHLIEQRLGETAYRTTTTLGLLLRDRPASDAEIGASVGYKLGRTRRYVRIWHG